MQTAEMRALGYAVYDAINAQNIELLEQLFDPDIIRHAMGEVGFEKAKQAMTNAFAATPELRFVVEDLLVDGDKIALRVTIQGRPIAPGQSQPMILEIFRVVNGRVAEIWGAGTATRQQA